MCNCSLEPDKKYMLVDEDWNIVLDDIDVSWENGEVESFECGCEDTDEYKLDMSSEVGMPKIKKIVVYNNVATKIYWRDGSDTTVTWGAGDEYDLEKAVFACIAKKYYGSYTNIERSLSRVKHVTNG